MNEDRNMRVGCMHEKRDILMSTIPIFFSFHKTNVWLLISGGFTMVSMGTLWVCILSTVEQELLAHPARGLIYRFYHGPLCG